VEALLHEVEDRYTCAFVEEASSCLGTDSRRRTRDDDDLVLETLHCHFDPPPTLLWSTLLMFPTVCPRQETQQGSSNYRTVRWAGKESDRPISDKVAADRLLPGVARQLRIEQRGRDTVLAHLVRADADLFEQTVPDPAASG